MCENRSCGRAIASNLIRFLCDVLNKSRERITITYTSRTAVKLKNLPRAKILKLVFQSDGLGNRDTI
jgi:hypothetical protein